MEVQDQGVGGFGFLSGLSLWLADGPLLAMSSHGLSSVGTPPVSSCGSCKDSGQIVVESTLTASFSLNYFFKGVFIPLEQ